MTPLSSVAHPTVDTFLLGFIVATSSVAILFFWKFWRSTRDPVFIAFAAFFAVQCVTYSVVTGFARPNEGSFWLFLLRLMSVIGILAAILWKNLRH